MKRDILLAHLTLRLAAGSEGPLPNLAVSLLNCVGERAGMTWCARNADLITHSPHTVAKFNEAAQGALGYEALLEILAWAASLHEITLFVSRTDVSEFDLEEQLVRGDFTPFRICIDLRDSTEWTFFSDSPEDLARAADLIASQNIERSHGGSA